MRRVGFQAHLEQVTLPDVVQMECLANSERALRVTSGDKTGYLIFSKGQLVHALTKKLRGELAAMEILRWKEGIVEPAPLNVPADPMIDKPWQSLLIESARLEDEAKLSPAATPREVRPAPVSEPPGREGLRRVARVDPSGNVSAAKGGSGAIELGETAAYAVRLADLVGEALGLEGPIAIEWSFPERQHLIYYEHSGSLLALEASSEANLANIKKKVGL